MPFSVVVTCPWCRKPQIARLGGPTPGHVARCQHCGRGVQVAVKESGADLAHLAIERRPPVGSDVSAAWPR